MTAITWGTTVTPAPDGDIVRRVPSLVSVNVGVQDDILAVVNTALDTRLFELGELDPRLKLARIYLALHFATGDVNNAAGADGPAGPVTAESAGGLSRSYASLGVNDPLLGETYWGRRFLELVRPKRFGVLVL